MRCLLKAAVAAVALTGCFTACTKKSENAESASRGSATAVQTEHKPNPDREAYFGDEHIHTSWSVDAWLMGN